jgi:hypothetical protein
MDSLTLLENHRAFLRYLDAAWGNRALAEDISWQLLYLFTSHVVRLSGPLSLRVVLGNSRLQWRQRRAKVRQP